MLEDVNSIQPSAITAPEAIPETNIFDLNRNKVETETSEDKPRPIRDKVATINKKVQKDKIERVAEAMQNYVKSIRTDLKIKVDNDTGVIVVKVISEDDGRVIREIPPEEVLELAAKVEELIGVFLNKNA